MVNSIGLRGKPLAVCAALAFSFVAYAPGLRANDACAVANGALDCQGDQSAGIGLTAPPAPGTLNVSNLSAPIAPATPVPGISLQSTRGSDLTVNSGTAQGPVTIVGTQAPGIAVSSQGIAQVPPVQQYDPLLNIPIPGSAGVSGGVVTVNNYGNITTSGAQAHGISAQTSTPGYDPALVGILQQFSASGIHFQVTSVAGAAAGTAVGGQVATQDANGLWVPSGVAAGTVTINADGSFSVNTGSGFGNLAIGAQETITVNYTLDGYRGTDLKASGVQGVLWVRVQMTASGPSIVAEGATFSSYGYVSLSPTATGQTALPDLQSYVNDLIAIANGSGGAGNGVTVNSPIGTIRTTGGKSYGIYAESRGAAGAPGGAGGGFFSSTAPTVGGTGYAGGPVSVTLGGSVITEGESSLGVFAHSAAGSGGPGGDGGTWHDGRQGGTGGTGGTIHVSGNGTITTTLDSAIGIYALSEGGDGGVGGEGHGAFNGGAGGFGGKGGTVDVEGSWTITTSGNSAYGIWAKSVGGNAGSGGSGGWLAGEPGSGGQASDGGSVTLVSGGKITTHGTDAYGLYAQSVGGFGGSGGSGGSIFYSRGGDANSAGSGGDVTLTNQAGGSVSTDGDRAHALYAQSIGGGGGAGGGGEALVGLGGSGGAGGDGGTVTVTNEGQLQTHGKDARGIYAQSIGGGGGDGGGSGGLVSIGGNASTGSNGGSVTVTNDGGISTGKVALPAKPGDATVITGDGSTAIYAQSVGGGGGAGGGAGGAFGLGATGGAGGNGSTVSVTNTALLQTVGNDARGIYAQSIGGGGGDGGDSAGLLAIGGKASTASNGGQVTVTNSGSISTGWVIPPAKSGDAPVIRGNGSDAIFAQSVGGGGGSGGSSSGWFSIGGAGGAGGDARSVIVNNSAASLQTVGSDASGIFAQSLGGGGGAGGNSVAVGSFASVSIGGQGGAAGKGSDVNVTSSAGTIRTGGDGSEGIFAQSIGGGGGKGGFAVSYSGAPLFSFSIGVGGNGGGGGDAGAATVVNATGIVTTGANSDGILADSTGGGGGKGGFSVAVADAGGIAGTFSIGGSGGKGGNGGVVNLTNSASVQTSGDWSSALQAQSVGGGGGKGGFSIAASAGGIGAVSLDIGGGAGMGGTANTVTLQNAGQLQTHGNDADGLLAQSVGGGGGTGGFAISLAGAGGGSGSLGVGGKGGLGDDANTVTVTNTGAIDTWGARSVGLFAQSVGGGGGSGGFSITGAGAGLGSGTFSIGGSGGGGGDASTVTVGNSAAIHTRGVDASGLTAQSMGGGGGNGAFSITGSGAGVGAGSIGVGGTADGGGQAGHVGVTNAGRIETDGDRSVGLLAQSVGGGGGNGGFSLTGAGAGTGAGVFSVGGGAGGGNDAGTVDVFNRSDILTKGAEAYGIQAQSLGGGGGNGGFTVSGAGAGTGAGSLTIGGAGGNGGDGKAVTVTAPAGTIQTLGSASSAIFAQSLGGGGGAGGVSLTATGAGTGAGTLDIGGSGGVASDGASVHVDTGATLITHGADAYGIYAQSVGGGGGSGGIAMSFAGAGTGAGNLTLGGLGSSGGDGAIVQVTSRGSISTGGDRSDGIFAQSLGGGGGNGGISIAAAAAASGSGTLSLGGPGGAGGDAKEVDVTTTGGTIQTTGNDAVGILAQSQGGGGGNGAFSFAGAAALQQAELGISVGGTGGGAGLGGTVQVVNGAAIATTGNGADAIFAQSVGGSGGRGGYAASLSAAFGESHLNVSTAVGGPGGDGNFAGAVTVNSSRSILTTGDDARGIVAQSVGGGGGDGGSSLAINLGVVKSEKPSGGLGLDLSVGGHGGNGSYGQAATVNNSGAIDTWGDGSIGIFAQSVGGGGGAGGTSRGLMADFNLSDPKVNLKSVDIEVNLRIGGNGGGASDGGTVTVNNSGNITTRGATSSGIYAQSVGGGGGDGGDGLIGVNPTVDATLALKEFIDFFDPRKIGIVLGGDSGSSGDGQAVTVTNRGNITTLGLKSYGIYAQSIGGGGGDVELYGTSQNMAGSAGKAEMGIGAKVGIGGANGAAGSGHAVTVDQQGDISTSGDGADAIHAQSVGGGGGEGSSVSRLSEARPWLNFGLGLALSPGGGKGGDGGTVSVTSSGTLTTHGAGANGIFAQSVGGGGGETGELGYGPQNALPLEFAGSVGAAGSGSSVTVTQNGSVLTTGVQANGIFAQSAGGEGTGGAVTVNVNGAINATGEGSYGVFAQSRGDEEAGDIRIVIGPGASVQGGFGQNQETADGVTSVGVAASGIRFEEGANNSLVNHGTVTSVAGASGMAVSGTAGNELVDNFGIVTGSVDLGEGNNSFHNETGATFNSGTTVNLGAGHPLTNDGIISPGGAATATTTTLTGDFVQTHSGLYVVSIDHATGASDRLVVDGMAQLGGQAQVVNVNSGFASPGSHEMTILSSTGAITGPGFSLTSAPSAVVSYRLVQPDPQDIALRYDVDFAPAGLNRNQAAIARYVSNAQLAGGSSGFAPVVANLVAQPDVPSLGAAYNRLSPEPHLQIGTGMLFSSLEFSDAMHSCEARDGDDRFIREGECGWLQVSGGEIAQRSSSEALGFTRRASSLSGGGQRRIGDGSWHAGFGLSYELSTLDLPGVANTEGRQLQAGVIVKKEVGATLLSADLSGGHGDYDTHRYVSIPNVNGSADSSPKVDFVAAHVRFAGAHQQGANFYLKPMLDIGAVHGWFPGFQETGVGGAGLNVQSRAATYTTATPALEIGGENRLGRQAVRPYARLGVTRLLAGSSQEVAASFQSAPAAVAPFVIQGQLDRTYLDVDLGVDVLFARGVTLHAGYSGRVSDHLRSNAGAFAAQAATASSGYDGRLSNGPGSNEATLTLSMPLQ